MTEERHDTPVAIIGVLVVIRTGHSRIQYALQSVQIAQVDAVAKGTAAAVVIMITVTTPCTDVTCATTCRLHGKLLQHKTTSRSKNSVGYILLLCV